MLRSLAVERIEFVLDQLNLIKHHAVRRECLKSHLQFLFLFMLHLNGRQFGSVGFTLPMQLHFGLRLTMLQALDGLLFTGNLSTELASAIDAGQLLLQLR